MTAAILPMRTGRPCDRCAHDPGLHSLRDDGTPCKGKVVLRGKEWECDCTGWVVYGRGDVPTEVFLQATTDMFFQLTQDQVQLHWALYRVQHALLSPGVDIESYRALERAVRLDIEAAEELLR
jgi:hypothetical protein